MKNKSILLLLLAAAFLALPCYGQNKKKAKEIEVPKDALICQLPPTYFEDQLKEHVEKWLFKMQFPASASAYTTHFQDCQHLSYGVVMQKLHILYAIAVHPDLEEVTHLPRSWYAKIFNAAQPLAEASKVLRSVNSIPREKTFLKAREMYVQVIQNVQAIYQNPPKKLSKDEWKEICRTNRKRREKEWIEDYKNRKAYEEQKRQERAANPEKKKSDRKKSKNGKDSEE